MDGGSDETLGERKESVSVKTPLLVGEKKKKKKVIRVVKKIVKKKVLKKLPKSGSKTSNCDSFGSNDTSVVTGIEKGGNVVDLSHWDRVEEPNVAEEEKKGVCLVEKERSVTDNDGMEIEKRAENLREFENVENVDARLVERSRDESEINDLVTSYLVSDQNGVELQDGHNDGIESKDTTDQNGIELQISDQNRVDDNDIMDVEQQHDSGKGVKELVVNSETDGSKLQEGLSESSVLSGQMVASWWHMKQRRKIFVHGLDKETKEDDIRKVFEKVGEVVEVKLMTDFNTGKSRGFGFVRYASADLADLALTKFRHVEIRGSTWHTAAVEANDTIVLNNIDKKWNNENVFSLLQKVGITKIDEVSVVPDPENTELNRGFAFIEFETKRDAQMAYRKLQIKNVFGERSKIKVAWAESLADPVEEVMHNLSKSQWST